MKKTRAAKKPERNFWETRNPNDPPLTPGCHEQLWQIAVRLPTDFEPYGNGCGMGFVTAHVVAAGSFRLWPFLWIGACVPTGESPCRAPDFRASGLPAV
jgi:hypothetical protein